VAEGLTTLESPRSRDEWLEARRLVEEYAASLPIDLSFQDFPQEIESLSRHYGAPDGCFIVAGRDGAVIGCGAFRRFSVSACEMKRLYVIPDRRGEGVGRKIVAALVDRARALGYRSMLLDTLPAMSGAQSLYASFGFTQTAPYRFNPVAGATYWKLDLMSKTMDQTVALLEKTPRALDALLRDLSDEWTRTNEGTDTWSAYDIVGHLVHGERTDWIPRAQMILEFGETRTFERFDRLAQEHESQGKSLAQLLDEFALVRSKSLDDLRALNLQPGDLDRRGRHPVFGAVTLGQLLATWAAHDLTHLHQISRVMAHQYREAVGPWSVFLGVLQCAGHSR
jgi:GNAT superfamily N-acetyltransferase